MTCIYCFERYANVKNFAGEKLLRDSGNKKVVLLSSQKPPSVAVGCYSVWHMNWGMLTIAKGSFIVQYLFVSTI